MTASPAQEERDAALELARLEVELRRQREQLEFARAELESFADCLSHDLMAPLRGVCSFSQEIIELSGAMLDVRSRKYLDYVHDSALLMTRQIEALLAIARISGDALESSRVNLGEVACEIARRLAESAPERQVEFALASDEPVVGDPRLLGMALQHLLGNAWKFSSKRECARIEFGTIASGAERVYFVRDDGAGFDMTAAHRLFKPFQRLHTAREFPGEGVGLAIVQRIVHRHGGKVRAEGELGRGATFYFTLPAPTDGGPASNAQPSLAAQGDPR